MKLTALGERPSWSPDGSEVWFIVQTFTYSSSGVRAVLVDGGAIREILPSSRPKATGSGSGVTQTAECRFSRILAPVQLSFFTVWCFRRDVLSSRSRSPHIPEALKNSLDNVILSRTRFQWSPSGTTLLLEVRSVEGVWNLCGGYKSTPGHWHGHAWSG